MALPKFKKPEERDLVFQSLHGEPLFTMLEDIVKAKDVESLKAMISLGKCNITKSDFLMKNDNGHLRQNSNMDPLCHPVVDALCCAMLQTRNVNFSFRETPGDIHSKSNHLTWKVNDLSSDMRFHIGEVFYDAINSFKVLAEKNKSTSAFRAGDFEENRKRTFAAIAAYAGFMNDRDLVLRMKEQVPEVMTLMVKPDMILEGNSHLRNKLVTPVCFAVHFSACRVLNKLSEEDVNAPVAEVDKKSDWYQLSHKRIEVPKTLTLVNLLEYTDNWRMPDMADTILNLAQYEGQTVNPNFSNWIHDTFAPNVCHGKATHLTDSVVQKFPNVLRENLIAVEEGAISRAHPGLLNLVIDRIDLSMTPDSYSFVHSSHPVDRLLEKAAGAKQKQVERIDSCLNQIIEEMGRREQLDYLIQRVRPAFNDTLAHAAATYNFSTTAIALIQAGMDMNIKDVENRTAIEEAEYQNNPDLVASMRSALSARTARNVLSELEAEFGISFNP